MFSIEKKRFPEKSFSIFLLSFKKRKKCSEGKDYPGTELERKKKWRQLFLEF